MPADFPASIFDPRTMENRPGAVYDEEKTKVIFAEDFNLGHAEIVAIEETLGVNPQGDFDTVGERIEVQEDKVIFANPYKARAYRSATYSIADGGPTLIQLNTDDYDPNGNFDTTSNYRYTAPVAGYYLVTGQVTLATNASKRLIGYIYKNGSLLIETAHSPAVATNNASLVSTIVYLAQNDYVDLRVYHDNGSAKNVIGGTFDTYLAVHLLSI